MENRLMQLTNVLQKKYPQIVFSSCDKNGKEYTRTIWLYDKNKGRSRNVFMEVWMKEKLDRLDFVLSRDLTNAEEEAEAKYDKRSWKGNKRFISKYHMTDLEFVKYVEGKLNRYCKLNSYELCEQRKCNDGENADII